MWKRDRKAQGALSDILFSMVSVFGGCCSNVFTLESMIYGSTMNVGSVVTFAQFLFVALEGLNHFFERSNPPFFLKPRKIPLKVSLLSVLLFYVGSATNNSVFMFNVSVPLHIVFRCSATAVTMCLGWLVAGKVYNKSQVISAVLLTIGAVITSLYRTEEFSWNNLFTSLSLYNGSSIDWQFLSGFLVMTLSSMLLSLYSLFNEWTFRRYGKHWRENIFYTHFLAMPLFLFDYKELSKEFKALLYDPNKVHIPIFELHISKTILMLVGNVLTQYVCVKGVNILASQTNALTVSVVLLIRKFISLLLSIYIFGNKLSNTGFVGAFLVFLGALHYSYSTALINEAKSEESAKKKE